MTATEVRIYADRSGHNLEAHRGLPRDVLRDLRARGWDRPYVVRYLPDTPTLDDGEREV